MDRERLKIGIIDLYQFFRYEKLPTSKQIDLWHENLKWIPGNAVDKTLKILKDGDNIPRNIPKAFKNAFSQCRGSIEVSRSYDKYDDPDFPIAKLWRALEILEQKGNDAFLNYCRAVQMPQQDIERVRKKFKCVHNMSDLKPKDIFESFGETTEREEKIRQLRKQKDQIL